MTIMYVCESCFENAPEVSGHIERNDLRVLPSNDWACETCYDDMSPSDAGYDSDEGVKPAWDELKLPPEYVEAR